MATTMAENVKSLLEKIYRDTPERWAAAIGSVIVQLTTFTETALRRVLERVVALETQQAEIMKSLNLATAPVAEPTTEVQGESPTNGTNGNGEHAATTEAVAPAAPVAAPVPRVKTGLGRVRLDALGQPMSQDEINVAVHIFNSV